MQTNSLEIGFVFFLLELTQLGFLLLFSRIRLLRTTPIMAWLKSSVFALLVFILLFAGIFDPSQTLWIFLFWLGQIPLLFMWWSTLQWGSSVTILRVLGCSDFPIDLHKWKQMTSFADKAQDLKDNRLDLLIALKLVRIRNETYEVTALGRFLNSVVKCLRGQK